MRIKLVAVLFLTVICLVAVLWGIDLSNAWEVLEGTAWWTVIPMFGMYIMAHGFRSRRLGLLLGEHVPFWGLFSVNAVGFLAINVVPLRLGEFVRPYLLFERYQVSFGRAVAAIVAERIIDLGMLLTMLLTLSVWVELPREGVMVAGVDVIRAGQQLAGVGVIFGVACALVVVWAGAPLTAFVARLPVVGRAAGFIDKLREGLARLLGDPVRLLKALIYTVGVWGCTLVGVGVVMWGVPGVPSGLGPVWTVWSITLAGMTALPTPGFFGGYELFCVAALWLWGVDGDIARTFAVTLHLTQFAFTCGLGGMFALREGWSLRGMVDRSRALGGRDQSSST